MDCHVPGLALALLNLKIDVFEKLIEHSTISLNLNYCCARDICTDELCNFLKLLSSVAGLVCLNR